MKTYDLLKTALNVSSTRANLISTNIANVNTDNYKGKRIEFETNLKEAMDKKQFKLITTHPKHLGRPDQNLEPRITSNNQTSLKENGNNVDLDIEMVDQATNGLYYQALTAQMNGRLKMLNYVTTH
ncbi:flagellar basal body rod protein FlgB [Enterococcus alcedinis]|nr:flagellar basal body rod protein FlgB [Enterococcus alcedinis]